MLNLQFIAQLQVDFYNEWFAAASNLDPSLRQEALARFAQSNAVVLTAPGAYEMVLPILDVYRSKIESDVDGLLTKIVLANEIVFTHFVALPEAMMGDQARKFNNDFIPFIQKIIKEIENRIAGPSEFHWPTVIANLPTLVNANQMVNKFRQDILRRELRKLRAEGRGNKQQSELLEIASSLCTEYLLLGMLYQRMHDNENTEKLHLIAEDIYRWFTEDAVFWENSFPDYNMKKEGMKSEIDALKTAIGYIDPEIGKSIIVLQRFIAQWSGNQYSKMKLTPELERVTVSGNPIKRLDEIAQLLENFPDPRRLIQLMKVSLIILNDYAQRNITEEDYLVIHLHNKAWVKFFSAPIGTEQALHNVIMSQQWDVVAKRYGSIYRLQAAENPKIASPDPVAPTQKKKAQHAVKKIKIPQAPYKKSSSNGSTSTTQEANKQEESVKFEGLLDEVPLSLATTSNTSKAGKSKKANKAHARKLAARAAKKAAEQVEGVMNIKNEPTVVQIELPKLSGRGSWAQHKLQPAVVEAPIAAMSVQLEKLQLLDEDRKFRVELPADAIQAYQNKIIPAVQALLSKAELEGRRAYIVGGWPRDAILGIKPNDFDIIIECSGDELEKWSPSVTKDPFIADLYKLGPLIDISIRRVGFDLYQDAMERDAKINALYFKMGQGIFDPLGAFSELQNNNQPLNMISPPLEFLGRDPKSILRMIHLKNKLNRPFARDMVLAIQCRTKLLQDVPFCVSVKFLDKLLKGSSCAASFNDLIYFNILPVIFPNLGSNFLLQWQSNAVLRMFIEMKLGNPKKRLNKFELVALLMLPGVVAFVDVFQHDLNVAIEMNCHILFEDYLSRNRISPDDHAIYKEKLQSLLSRFYNGYQSRYQIEVLLAPSNPPFLPGGGPSTPVRKGEESELTVKLTCPERP